MSTPMNRPLQSHLGHHRTASSSKRTIAEVQFAEETEASKKRKTMRLVQESEEVKEMKKALGNFTGICGACKVGKGVETTHTITRCPTVMSIGEGFTTYKQWRSKLRYTKHHTKICWTCHVPQCSDQLHRTFVGGQNRDSACDWPDTVGPVAYLIYQLEELRGLARTEFEMEWETLETYTEWLMSKPEAGHYSKLMDMFMWYCTSVLMSGE
ncbi:hypothetical protein BV22DRAFT_1049165 [Leucogyrophana mollusca]|uniref:Uncharacterized protein n=1 Tax=Leucogyrophana mollusca TaxID=85980 RepID=A0ACB8B9D7_9AGAM|nr:hypothetical protein BV22DRAFT_1049165 [Leucogyrophana mollusca]